MNNSFSKKTSTVLAVHCLRSRSGSGGAIGAIAPPKTNESNFIHHDFVQFRKKHSRYNAILPYIIWSHRWSIGYFISLTVVNPQMTLDYQILLKSSPLNLLAGSTPAAVCSRGGQTYSMYEPHIVKPKLQNAAT